MNIITFNSILYYLGLRRLSLVLLHWLRFSSLIKCHGLSQVCVDTNKIVNCMKICVMSTASNVCCDTYFPLHAFHCAKSDILQTHVNFSGYCHFIVQIGVLHFKTYLVGN